jgi:hypothetical protein
MVINVCTLLLLKIVQSHLYFKCLSQLASRKASTKVMQNLQELSGCHQEQVTGLALLFPVSAAESAGSAKMDLKVGQGEIWGVVVVGPSGTSYTPLTFQN